MAFYVAVMDQFRYQTTSSNPFQKEWYYISISFQFVLADLNHLASLHIKIASILNFNINSYFEKKLRVVNMYYVRSKLTVIKACVMVVWILFLISYFEVRPPLITWVHPPACIQDNSRWKVGIFQKNPMLLYCFTKTQQGTLLLPNIPHFHPLHYFIF